MLDKGTRVWIPHSSKVWSSGVVLRSEDGTNRLIVLCDGEESYLSRENPPFLCNPEILLGANDLTTLSYLHEPAVLHSLQLRYEQSAMIYTYCGKGNIKINIYFLYYFKVLFLLQLILTSLSLYMVTGLRQLIVHVIQGTWILMSLL